MARGQSWADEKNRQSVLKEEGKTRKLEKAARDERHEDLLGRFGDDPGSRTPENVRQILRAVVEGDAHERTPRLQGIDDEISARRGQLVEVTSGLALGRAQFRSALSERDEHLKHERAWNDHGRKAKTPSSAGSKKTVWGLTGLLIVIEGVLLTPPAENIVRLLFPGLGDATAVALLGVAALVGLGAAAVIAAARETKDHSVQAANARVVAAAADDDEPTLFEAPSPFMMRAFVSAAALVQLLMVFLRLQYETGDGSGRNILVIVSVIVAVQALMIGLMEFRRHEATTALPTTYDERSLLDHTSLHGEEHELRRRIGELELERIAVHVGYLREFQQIGGQLNLPNVLAGINSLVDQYDTDAKALRDAAPVFEPLDMDVPEPTEPPVPTQRSAPGPDAQGGRSEEPSPNHVAKSVTLP